MVRVQLVDELLSLIIIINAYYMPLHKQRLISLNTFRRRVEVFVAPISVPGAMCAQQGIGKVAQMTKTWAFHDKSLEPRRLNICIWRGE